MARKFSYAAAKFYRSTGECMGTTASDFTWKFHRLGGLDQVTLRTAEELTHLHELNPKLWAALSCPASGLEFNQRALALIDADKDGRIRVPEVLAAVAWLNARLANPADMVDAPPELPLERIAIDTPAGRHLLDTAKSVLDSLGKTGAAGITYEDVAEALTHASQKAFNGDAVVPPHAEFGPDAAAFITDALAVIGGVPDASGVPGVNADIANAFTETLRAWQTWRGAVDHAATPLGASTAEAWKLLLEIDPKVEDYFLRCEMAAFAPRACTEPGEENRPTVPEHGLMETAALGDMPLARIEPDRPLSMTKGVNPAWRARMARFASLAAPLLPNPDVVTRQDWAAMHAALAPFEEALSKKPVPVKAEVTIAPTGSLDQLGGERVALYLSKDTLNTVLGLIAEDAAAPAAATDIADLERLVLYHAHLHRLLMNFVSFHDFYSLRHKAAFQSGTLYLDGRSCRLCLPVEDVAKHATLAALSHLCLVYCLCRRAKDKPDSGEESMTIVAAVTAGAADMLVEGRKGVFVDSAGSDWDATVAKVVANPISIRQAIWDPYRRASRMIGEQIGKFAAAKQADMAQHLAGQAADTAGGKAPQSFDIGKSMGIFAAIGLALGALGTALASILRGLFSLAWWQFPLVFAGLFLLVSGPSMLLAWLKLRKRTLGPLLDASGWAVNSLAPVNFKLGGQLTGTAELPRNATRSFNDPLGQPRRWPAVLALALGLILAGAGAYVWYKWPAVTLPWST